MDKRLRAKVKRQRTALLAELGEAVTTWNQLEGEVRNLLTRLMCASEQALLLASDRSGDVDKAIIRARFLTTHMGNTTLTDAIRGFAKTSEQPLRDHLEHIAKLFDRLREHRNFYVHGTKGPGANIDEHGTIKTGALATSVSARGSLSVVSMRFGLLELREFREHMGKAAGYAQHILHEALNPDLPAPGGAFPPLSSREKPPLPGRLLTSRQFLIGEAPPP